MQESTIAAIAGFSALFGAVAAFLTAWFKGQNSLKEQIDRRLILLLKEKEKTISERDETIVARDDTIKGMKETIENLVERVSFLERKEHERSDPEIVP